MDERFTINVDELRNKYRNKCNMRMKIYEKLLEKCYIRIKNSFENSDTFCLYPIPDFILGMPSYNLAYCAAYIIFDLNKNGYTTKFYNPNVILIKWDYEQPSYLLENTPHSITLQQTKLLMPPTSNPIKNQTFRIETQEFPQKIYNNQQKSIEIPKQIKYKSINDYKPSGRFLS